jgi:lysophospholipase L1-like esterase
MKASIWTIGLALSLLAGAVHAWEVPWLGAWGYAPLAPGAAAPAKPAAPVANASSAAAATTTKAVDPRGVKGPERVADQTISQRVRVSVAGDHLRLRFSDEFLASPLVIAKAAVAVLDGERIGLSRPILFEGRPSVNIPAGAPMLSDPIDLPVSALQTLVVTLYLPQATELPGHLLVQTLAPGGAVGDAGATLRLGAIITEVDVQPRQPLRVIVALGDSITEGTGATPMGFKTWPDQLATRLAGRAAVVNEGIGGNRLLNARTGDSALTRFDRDVLAVPGVTDVILLEGINDIVRQFNPEYGESATAAELVAGYRQIIARAHEHGLSVHIGTITPFVGSRAYSDAGEAIRQTVNAWIRQGDGFDGVIDFDAAVRDPEGPNKLRREYQSGDWLHPSDAGYAAMAQTVPIAGFVTPPSLKRPASAANGASGCETR